MHLYAPQLLLVAKDHDLYLLYTLTAFFLDYHSGISARISRFGMTLRFFLKIHPMH